MVGCRIFRFPFLEDTENTGLRLDRGGKGIANVGRDGYAGVRPLSASYRQAAPTIMNAIKEDVGRRYLPAAKHAEKTFANGRLLRPHSLTPIF